MKRWLARWAKVVLPVLLEWPCVTYAAQPPDDLHVHFRLWTEAAFTAQAPNDITAGGQVDVHGPIYWPFRQDGSVAFTLSQAASATSFDFTAPETWGTYASGQFSLWQVAGGYHRIPSGFVFLAPEERYAFFTSLTKHNPPLQHYLRQYGAGVRLGLVDSDGDEKATFSVLYGKDGRCGDFGNGQVTVDGVVPIYSVPPSAKLAGLDVAFGADACLSVGSASNPRQRDALEARVIVEWAKK